MDQHDASLLIDPTAHVVWTTVMQGFTDYVCCTASELRGDSGSVNDATDATHYLEPGMTGDIHS